MNNGLHDTTVTEPSFPPRMPGSQIVHVIGSGHSGSTLLDMLLGGHSQISSLGEALFLHFNLRGSREFDVCTCGQHVRMCPFWTRVEETAREVLPTAERPALTSLRLADERMGVMIDERGRFQYPMPHFIRSRVNEAVLVLGSRFVQRVLSHLSVAVRRHREIGRDMLMLYELVRRAHGTPIIVDSTKNPGTFKNIYMQADVPMKLILMVRDGRAVCRSRMRRDRISMRDAARIWRIEHLRRQVAQFTIPNDRVFTVRYEDLASRPEATLRRICDYLEVNYECGMLDFRHDRHNVGGNPMRFRRSDHRIVIDEAWKTDLTAEDAHSFDDVAGSVNRRLGY